MRKAIVSLLGAALLVVPFASPAQACDPENNNPCDIQPIPFDPVGDAKELYCKIKGC